MNILAIVGSPRKGKATEYLVDKAVAGVQEVPSDLAVRKLHLSDYDIHYCTNCLVCRDRETYDAVSPCVIRDGMDQIIPELLAADGLILGTPVHMGCAPALVMAFLERICWTFARPVGKELIVSGCPVPRSPKRRKAVVIVVSGIVPPVARRFCDDVTPLVKQTFKDSLNAQTVGDMYAGDIEHRGVQRYGKKAFSLGRKLADTLSANK